MENAERLKRFQEIAAQDELTEQELESKQTKTLGEILENTNKTRYVYVKRLDCKLAYKELPVTTLAIFADKNKTNEELTVDIVYQLLHGADPNVTKEQVEKLPLNIATEIIAKTVGTSFLPAS